MCHGLNMLNNLHIFALLLIKSKLRCKKYLTGTCNIACVPDFKFMLCGGRLCSGWLEKDNVESICLILLCIL